MDNTELFIKDHTTTSLLIHVLKSIPCLHVFSRKITLVKLKVDTVLAQQLREECALDLEHKIIDSITKDKVAFVGWVGVQVQIEEKPLILVVVFNEFPDGIT